MSIGADDWARTSIIPAWEAGAIPLGDARDDNWRPTEDSNPGRQASKTCALSTELVSHEINWRARRDSNARPGG